ncbi:DUF2141 domain-containing protein [Undibacterium flavidum]|uniref:DUF2141 domain-containing protein n=1 Tax=Undibacterium flavidum TaxID=2762297 RepID=A0ABR6YB47_9BURK|nr:DUF2141 domain-containing protein [Undibacterium flavidum]MBC3873811.1 DUF2141 domain-containing protein [Undibacterium flavidum]
MLKFTQLLISLALLSSCAEAMATDVTVRITSVDADRKGKILVQLCQEKDFLVRDCRFQKVQDVKAEVEVVIFKDVPEGTWAAMAFHDENSNEKLDTNNLGIPTEGTGFSKNAKGQYGPPKFASAAENISGKSSEFKFRLVY